MEYVLIGLVLVGFGYLVFKRARKPAVKARPADKIKVPAAPEEFPQVPPRTDRPDRVEEN